jgi:uncharacterized membrane protein YraQ (UPF0718 family)
VATTLLAASTILLLISPDKVTDTFVQNVGLLAKTLIATLAAVGISVAIHYYLPDDFAERYLSRNEFRYLLYAGILGILTPGPLYAIYPIVLALKAKGIRNAILVSYITGQAIIGPARTPFEVGLFGIDFFAYRLLLSLVMAPLAGMLYILLSRFFPDTK